MAPRPDQTLSHYRLIEKIGEGGMGVVWKALDTTLDREVAIKILPEELSGDPERLTRFRREAKAVAALNHPNIVTLHSVEDADTSTGSVHFITMELVQGRTLAELIPRAGLTLARFLDLALPLANAISAAHERGVTHRDLKPGNVMVGDDGPLKVLDFGLAKLREQAPAETTAAPTQSMTGEGRVLGTVPYMSPEQAQGKPLDHRSDIFSLGIVLHEMATGQRPFRGETSADLISSILRDTPRPVVEINPALPRDLGRVITRCLRKDPRRRFQTALDVRNELEEIEEEANSVDAPTAPELADSKPSLAVLPFENLSPDPDNEYFSDGITEEIISKLSVIEGLQVAARTSVVRFKGSQKDVKQIGEQLSVRYVLEGSVRKAGNRVRITAQLIDTSTGFHLWAESFDGELEDIFGVQEATALKIAEALDLQLSPQEKQAVTRRFTENADAYDAYLRGQASVQEFEYREKLEAARTHYARALELDGDFVPALAGLASVEAHTYRNIDPDPARLERAERFAQRALALDPRLPRALVATGEVFAVQYDYRRAAERFRDATQLDSEDSWSWDMLSWALGYQRPPDARGAEQAAREALRLQPGFVRAYYHLGRALGIQGRYEEAAAAMGHVLEASPDSGIARYGLAELYLAQGKFDAALEEMQADTNLQASAVGQFLSAAVHAARNETDAALNALERALLNGFRDLAAIDTSPYFAGLRSDVRFQEMRKRATRSA